MTDVKTLKLPKQIHGEVEVMYYNLNAKKKEV